MKPNSLIRATRAQRNLLPSGFILNNDHWTLASTWFKKDLISWWLFDSFLCLERSSLGGNVSCRHHQKIKKRKKFFFNRAKTMFQFLQPRILTWIVIALKKKFRTFLSWWQLWVRNFEPCNQCYKRLQACIYKSVKQTHF